MKKIIFLIILAAGIYFGYTKYQEYVEKNKFIYEDILTEVGENTVNIDSFTIYGKHLNISGNLPSNSNYNLILKNNEEEIILKTSTDSFNTSEYINDGINLDKLKLGKYILLLHDTTNNKYYNIINNSNYHDNKYYTITKNNKNNLITFNEEIWNTSKYFTIEIKEEKLPEDVYDIVIDPGHGGIDTGAGNGRYNETNFTLDYAKTLKEELEKEGLKVKLTRETDVKIDHYGEGSRTGIPYETKAKLMLSIHLNSSNYKSQHGVEIYRAYETNNDFAKVLADNIVTSANQTYSINPINKVIDGVYMRTYSKEDKIALAKEAKQLGYEAYTVGDNVTYYYFIREVGGIMTKAFSDGRNPKYKENIYRNNNQAAESYLCELAYISNNNDLNSIINNKTGYITALKDSILTYVNN
jgi:N-acetylmuramoyl-L-alanine amidase